MGIEFSVILNFQKRQMKFAGNVINTGGKLYATLCDGAAGGYRTEELWKRKQFFQHGKNKLYPATNDIHSV